MKPLIIGLAILGVVLLGVAAILKVRYHFARLAQAQSVQPGSYQVDFGQAQANARAKAFDDVQKLLGTGTPFSAKIPPDLKQAYLFIVEKKPDDALALLNPAIQSGSTDPAFYSARSLVYIQQGHLEEARQDLLKAVQLGDKSSLLKFDLAEVDFLEKKYDSARLGFLALETDLDRGDLSSYKVFLCDLLAGHEDQAMKELGAFNLASSNPSYYFANVAWNLYHHQPDEGRKWLDPALRIYSPRQVERYSYSLNYLGYLPIPPSSTHLQPSTSSTSAPPPK